MFYSVYILLVGPLLSVHRIQINAKIEMLASEIEELSNSVKQLKNLIFAHQNEERGIPKIYRPVLYQEYNKKGKLEAPSRGGFVRRSSPNITGPYP